MTPSTERIGDNELYDKSYSHFKHDDSPPIDDEYDTEMENKNYPDPS